MGFLICRDLDDAHVVNRGLRDGDTSAITNTFEAACRNIAQYQKADLIVGQLALPSWWAPTNKNNMISDPISSAHLRMKAEANLLAAHTDSYVALANKSDFEHGYCFTGESLLVDPNGKTLGQASSGMEIIYIDLPLNEAGRLLHPNSLVETSVDSSKSP